MPFRKITKLDSNFLSRPATYSLCVFIRYEYYNPRFHLKIDLYSFGNMIIDWDFRTQVNKVALQLYYWWVNIIPIISCSYRYRMIYIQKKTRNEQFLNMTLIKIVNSSSSTFFICEHICWKNCVQFTTQLSHDTYLCCRSFNSQYYTLTLFIIFMIPWFCIMWHFPLLLKVIHTINN